MYAKPHPSTLLKWLEHPEDIPYPMPAQPIRKSRNAYNIHLDVNDDGRQQLDLLYPPNVPVPKYYIKRVETKTALNDDNLIEDKNIFIDNNGIRNRFEMHSVTPKRVRFAYPSRRRFSINPQKNQKLARAIFARMPTPYPHKSNASRKYKKRKEKKRSYQQKRSPKKVKK